MVPVANIPMVTDRLEGQMCDAVISFARTGNPNHVGLPLWPTCTPDDEATMIFDRDCMVRHNFDDDLLRLHVSASPKLSLEGMKEVEKDVQH